MTLRSSTILWFKTMAPVIRSRSDTCRMVAQDFLYRRSVMRPRILSVRIRVDPKTVFHRVEVFVNPHQLCGKELSGLRIELFDDGDAWAILGAAARIQPVQAIVPAARRVVQIPEVSMGGQFRGCAAQEQSLSLHASILQSSPGPTLTVMVMGRQQTSQSSTYSCCPPETSARRVTFSPQ